MLGEEKKEVTDLSPDDLEEELTKRALIISYDDKTQEVSVEWEGFTALEVPTLLTRALEVFEDPDD